MWNFPIFWFVSLFLILYKMLTIWRTFHFIIPWLLDIVLHLFWNNWNTVGRVVFAIKPLFQVCVWVTHMYKLSTLSCLCVRFLVLGRHMVLSCLSSSTLFSMTEPHINQQSFPVGPDLVPWSLPHLCSLYSFHLGGPPCVLLEIGKQVSHNFPISSMDILFCSFVR